MVPKGGPAPGTPAEPRDRKLRPPRPLHDILVQCQVYHNEDILTRIPPWINRLPTRTRPRSFAPADTKARRGRRTHIPQASSNLYNLTRIKIFAVIHRSLACRESDPCVETKSAVAGSTRRRHWQAVLGKVTGSGRCEVGGREALERGWTNPPLRPRPLRVPIRRLRPPSQAPRMIGNIDAERHRW